MTYAAKQDKGGRRYYDLVVKRRDAADGKAPSGIAATITLALHTGSEQEVAALVKRLEAVRGQCVGRKG
ncbi:hypothetical protein JAO73_13685 [Hymenobacter sp. BT523]|uniref:hypothetical protein n=1 Tax=Hymenobacter sp. BT523 TaxID=2795725 RepID=UPI0018ED6B02|nr:hypothetical protein [Hymenobacter sp. BT523]MBJ6110069.1 hypothetical protein [Hymenobacter sp. BT523]